MSRSIHSSISGLSIRRHIGTLMLALAVMVTGLYFVNRLPVDLLPSITYPRIGIRLNVDGITPEVAVDEITRPLEEAVSTVEGVEQIYSQTREGRVRVDLYFAPGGNVDQALNDTTAAVNRARSQLPDDSEAPRIFKFDPSQLPVYELALTSPELQGVDLRRFAEDELERELVVVPGVASVDIAGGIVEEVQVDLDLDRIQALGLGLTDILNDIQARNQDISGGRLQGGFSEALTRTVGRFRDPSEIRDLRFTTPNGTVVRLSEFAQIEVRPADEGVRVTLNGDPAVRLSIQKQPEANTILVVDAIKRRLGQLQQSGLITPTMILTATTDESRFIRSSIKAVATAGFTGAALAGVAVLLFLGSLRQTLIVVMAIPLATLTAIVLMGGFGLSINIISLGGLALGVGIVVDNAIVMLENITRGIEAVPTSLPDYSQRVLEQAERSSHEVESALIASTMTNLVAVLPFLLIGGIVSLLFNELLLTISFAVAGSLVVGLTVVPMLTSRLLSIPISSGIRRVWLWRGFAQGLGAGTVAYQRTLALLLRRPLLLILLAFLVLGGGSYGMLDHLDQELLPRISTGQARLFANFAPSTTLETNYQIMQAVDQILLDQPETDYVFTTAGGFAFGGNTTENPLRGTSSITLKPGSPVGPFVDQVNGSLRQLNLVGSRIRVAPGTVRGLSTRTSAVDAEVDVVLQSEDAQILQQAGQLVLRTLDEQATLATFRPDADANQPEVQIIPDWERATPLRLNLPTLGRVVQTAVQGLVPTQLQRGEQLIDIRVQLANGSVTQPSQLQRLPLFVQNNQPIRLGDVATVALAEAPGEIQRINQRQVFIIEGSLTEAASQNAALTEVDQIMTELELPAGVTLLPSEVLASNQALRQSLIVLGSLAAFLVFVVMAVQYNSLIDPLVIILSVPLALSGGILGLYVTETPVGMTVMVGAILLIGIVVNNAILMVELANQIRQEQDLDYRSAILQAAPRRLRPILMTTVTTVLGLFPLALGLGEGSELLQPLGVVVFSGLSVATLLTLFIIPCFYVVLHGSTRPPRKQSLLPALESSMRPPVSSSY